MAEYNYGQGQGYPLGPINNPYVDEKSWYNYDNAPPTGIRYPGGNPAYPQRYPYSFNPAQGNIPYAPQEKRGFNLSNITGPGIMGGLQWLGDKFKRPEAKQRAYESIMGDRKGLGLWESQVGKYGGNEYELMQTPSGLKVSSDLVYDKNFDSMFGSESLEEMEQKKLDWAQKRLQEGKGLSQRLRNILIQRGMAGDAGNITKNPLIDLTTIRDKVVTDTAPSTGGEARHDYQRDRGGGYTLGGGFTGTRGQVGRAGSSAGEGRGHHSWRAEGGRIGYRNGEFVEDVNIEGPGFEENIEMASAPDVMDSLNDMSMEVFGKGLHELTPEEYQILMDMANEQAAGGQGEGLASLV